MYMYKGKTCKTSKIKMITDPRENVHTVTNTNYMYTYT